MALESKNLKLKKVLVLAECYEYLKKKENVKKKRQIWVQPWLSGGEIGQQATLVFKDIHDFDENGFKQYFRMDKESFHYILEKVRPIIEKEDTKFRNAISAEVRLMITLIYLASGSSFSILSGLFRVSVPSISIIIPNVCDAIWETMVKEELKFPSSPDEWKKIADDFERRWQYPMCLGAIDGKHCNVKKFGNSSSAFYNYKGNFSIILLGVSDAHSRFIFVDIGAQGTAHDSTVFKVSIAIACIININLPTLF